LLLAYPLDLWNSEHIKRAVKDFGVFVAWDEEASSYGAIVIKVRVVALQNIDNPQVQGITVVQFDKYLSVEPTRS
jgi:hypothetical protein